MGLFIYFIGSGFRLQGDGLIVHTRVREGLNLAGSITKWRPTPLEF